MFLFVRDSRQHFRRYLLCLAYHPLRVVADPGRMAEPDLVALPRLHLAGRVVVLPVGPLVDRPVPQRPLLARVQVGTNDDAGRTASWGVVVGKDAVGPSHSISRAMPSIVPLTKDSPLYTHSPVSSSRTTCCSGYVRPNNAWHLASASRLSECPTIGGSCSVC